MTLKVQLSSCVPATDLETSGARLLPTTGALRGHPSGLGLAEMMNFPGVLAKDPVVLDKLVAFAGWQSTARAAGARLRPECLSGRRGRAPTTRRPRARRGRRSSPRG